MSGFLGSYGKDFDPFSRVGRKAWEEDRHSRIMGKSSISVKLSDLAVSVGGGKAVVKFKRTYSADPLNVSSRKTLESARSGERWVILSESTGRCPVWQALDANWPFFDVMRSRGS